LENVESKCTLIAVNDKERYRGVRGWLLLLCINLTILDPTAIVLGVFSAISIAKPDFERYPELMRMLVVSGICRLALAVFSIYVGAALWRVRPEAPNAAKLYFRIASIYSAFALLLPRMVGLPDELYRQMAGATLVASTITLCYVAAWYAYLVKSKRVKATFEPKN
jgi:hypothetical protein